MNGSEAPGENNSPSQPPATSPADTVSSEAQGHVGSRTSPSESAETGWVSQQLADVARRHRPGSVPGQVVSDPSTLPVRIRIIQYDQHTLEEVDITSTDEIRKFCDRPEVTWVNVDGLRDTHLISEIGEIFGIHRLVLEDIVNPHQRAKVETFEGQTVIVARMPELSHGFDTEQISMVLCDQAVITFQERRGDCLDPVRNRIRSRLGRICSQDQDYLVYALLDAIIDAYFPVLSKIGERLDRVERQMVQEPSVDVVAILQRIRSLLFVIRGILEPHQIAVAHLLRSNSQFSDDTRIYLRDCADHLNQVLHACETSRELAADLRDYCFAELSFNQNETMKTLTVMASVFIPLSFIAGFYGMNFDPAVSSWNMPETRWRYGYAFAITLMVAVATLTLGGLRWLAISRRKARKRRFRKSQQLLSE